MCTFALHAPLYVCMYDCAYAYACLVVCEWVGRRVTILNLYVGCGV